MAEKKKSFFLCVCRAPCVVCSTGLLSLSPPPPLLSMQHILVHHLVFHHVGFSTLCWGWVRATGRQETDAARERLRNLSQLLPAILPAINCGGLATSRLWERCRRLCHRARDKAETSLFMENGGEITVS